jgi:hypothetical protein
MFFFSLGGLARKKRSKALAALRAYSEIGNLK